MIEQQWSALFLQAYLQTKSENVQPDDDATLALTQGQSSHQLQPAEVPAALQADSEVHSSIDSLADSNTELLADSDIESLAHSEMSSSLCSSS